eukprot:2052281-Pleurochrysis_carterae.AAC.1
MDYAQWGHTVATLPMTNGTILHIHRIPKVLRIKVMREILYHCVAICRQAVIIRTDVLSPF